MSHAAWRVTRRRGLATSARRTSWRSAPSRRSAADAAAELAPFPDLRWGWGLDLHWARGGRERGAGSSAWWTRWRCAMRARWRRLQQRGRDRGGRAVPRRPPFVPSAEAGRRWHAQDSDAMRVAVVAEYYPRRRDPVLGVWAHRQALAARDAGADVPCSPASVRCRPRRPCARPAGSAVRSPERPYSPPRRARRARGGVRALSLAAAQRSYATWHSWARGPLGKALGRLHEQRPFDLVHAHYALPAGGAALEFTERECRWSISVHGGDVLGPLVPGPPLGRASARCSAGRARCCATVADARALRRADGDAERMTVVHLGAEAPANAVAKRAEPTVATLAHVIPRKRHADVMRGPGGARGAAAPRLAGDRRRPRAAGARAAAPRSSAWRTRVDWAGQLPRRGALTNWPAATDGAAERGRGVRRGLRGGAGVRRAGDRLSR